MNIVDVRAQMPNYDEYKDWRREGKVLGIAVHHSATADFQTGAPSGDAFTFFDYHVNGRGWSHGGYNYVITPDGTAQYALDEEIPAYHAGFRDTDDSQGLEYGQYWNNHYLAICVSGWFSDNRTYRGADGVTRAIPNNFTRPSAAQWETLLELILQLMSKYQVPVENVRVHRELAGNQTGCPGANVDPFQLRQQIRERDPFPPSALKPEPGEHVLVLPDTNDTFSVALGYIWKFQPDVSFASQAVSGRWRFVTVLGAVDETLLDAYRQNGAVLVQNIDGSLTEIREQLEKLTAQNHPFILEDGVVAPPDDPPPPPPPEVVHYTVQSGDTLSKIAQHFYGNAALWRIIFDANRDKISNPALIHVGQILTIPPKP